MFEGEVVGLIGAGAFVAFGGGYEGLLPVRRLRGDWWELNELGTMLDGTRTGEAIRLGDPVTVRGRARRRAARAESTCSRLRCRSQVMAKKGKRKAAPGDVASNRQASHRYTFLDKLEAGLVLTGTEVKSLREGKAHAQGRLRHRARRRGLAAQRPHPALRPGQPREPRARAPAQAAAAQARDRAPDGLDAERGLTLVPTRMYFKGPRAKVEIALARGKDLYDKRESIKKRDTQREMQRALREAERDR